MNSSLKSLIDACSNRYFRERDRYGKLAERVADVIREDIIEQNAIRAHVTYRAKSVSSFEGKLRRVLAEKEHIVDEHQVFNELNDLAGVRVTAYRRDDLAIIAHHLTEFFSGYRSETLVPTMKEYPENPENFYTAYHCDVTLKEDSISRDLENLRDTRCEVQICSIISHVWNEVEHDIGYKPSGEPGPEERSLLLALGHLTRTGEELITQLMAANQKRLEAASTPFTDAFDFAARMRKRYPGIDMSRNVYKLYEYLENQGLTTPELINEYLGAELPMSGIINFIRDFNSYLEEAGETPYRLHPTTSDVMFVELLRKDKEAELIAERIGKSGRGRPTRMKTLTEQFIRYRQSIQAETSMD